jgi:hypothetical protein
MIRFAPLHVLALILSLWLSVPTYGGEWLGGQRTSYVIKSVEPKGAILNGPEIRVTDKRLTDPIYVIGSIRRERSTAGTVIASVGELRPGVRIRAHGSFGSSPFGFIADRIVILKE